MDTTLGEDKGVEFSKNVYVMTAEPTSLGNLLLQVFFTGKTVFHLLTSTKDLTQPYRFIYNLIFFS